MKRNMGSLGWGALVAGIVGALFVVATADGQLASDSAKRRIAQIRSVGWPAHAPSIDRWGDDLVDPELGYVPGELLIRFSEGRPWAAVEASARALRASEVETYPWIGVRRWKIQNGMTPAQAIDALARSPMRGWIEFAEPNHIWHVEDFPSDTLRGDLYGMHNVGQSPGTLDADIDAPEAWQLQTGSADVIVGIIDTGIDYEHPDLADNIWVNPDEVAGNGVDDDANGYVDDVQGWDFVNNDNDPMDDNGHGSHTAGTVGAIGNNGVGVVGVCWNVKLMPLKFLNSGGSGSTDNAVKAIHYAAAKGVPITSNSWGGGKKSRTLESAIANSGSLFVAAAGNSGSSTPAYPAGYTGANILSVAATDANDALAGFSNYGTTWVDLGAPGVNTLSCAPGGGYAYKSGTSMACPHTAGAAALLLAQFPGSTVAQLKDRILNNLDLKPSLTGKTLTGGRLNVRKAIGASEFPMDSLAPSPIADLAVQGVEPSNASVTLSWTATGDDGILGTAYLYDLRFALGTAVTESEFLALSPEVATMEPNPQQVGSLEGFAVAGLRPGKTYSFALYAVDEAGNRSALSNIVTATLPGTNWDVKVVSPVSSSYVGMDLRPGDGYPGVAFGDYGTDTLRFAQWNGSGWDLESVRSGHSGVSMAYDPIFDAPTVTNVPDKLYFNAKSGNSWSTEVLASRRIGRDISWLAYDPGGNPGVAFRSNGLGYAYRSGGVWSIQTVHAGVGARYMSLAFDPAGRPGIAYSDDVNGDGQLDAIRYAHWNGASWDLELVETGPPGYGVNAAVAFHPVTGFPAVAHRAAGGAARFLYWDGAAWVAETPIPSGGEYAFGCAIAYHSDGTAYLATSQGPDYYLQVATRAPAGGWTAEVVDVEGGMPFLFVIRVDSSGKPVLAYGSPEIRFARRN